MSKLGCICGHVIRDQTDQLPYKGRILRDFDECSVFDSMNQACESLVAAVMAGDRESWLQEHFLDGYPRDLPNGEVFHDFAFRLFLKFTTDIYECEACGRLLVQQPGIPNHFTSYIPESGNVMQVLRSPHDTRDPDPLIGPDFDPTGPKCQS